MAGSDPNPPPARSSRRCRLMAMTAVLLTPALLGACAIQGKKAEAHRIIQSIKVAEKSGTAVGTFALGLRVDTSGAAGRIAAGAVGAATGAGAAPGGAGAPG